MKRMDAGDIEALVAAVPAEQQGIVREQLPWVLGALEAGDYRKAVSYVVLMCLLVQDVTGTGVKAPEVTALLGALVRQYPKFRDALQLFWDRLYEYVHGEGGQDA
jgi:hypothetical protein